MPTEGTCSPRTIACSRPGAGWGMEQPLQRDCGSCRTAHWCTCCRGLPCLQAHAAGTAQGAKQADAGDPPVDDHEDRAPENGGDAVRAAAGGPPLALPLAVWPPCADAHHAAQCCVKGALLTPDAVGCGSAGVNCHCSGERCSRCCSSTSCCGSFRRPSVVAHPA